jgi:hypothetical protein
MLPIAAMADAQTPEKKAELCLLCHGAVEGKYYCLFWLVSRGNISSIKLTRSRITSELTWQ